MKDWNINDSHLPRRKFPQTPPFGNLQLRRSAPLDLEYVHHLSMPVEGGVDEEVLQWEGKRLPQSLASYETIPAVYDSTSMRTFVQKIIGVVGEDRRPSTVFSIVAE